MRVRIGTSGWQYPHWRRRFYPADVPTREWLAFYVDRFDTVELNNSFYRLPDREQFARWAAAVPERFEFAVKASRYLTHGRRLVEPEEPVRRLMDAASGLGARLGPILLQLPPDLHFEPERLDGTLAAFPERARIAVEFRHDTWSTDRTRRILERHGAALCLADRRRPVTPLWATTDWTYLRLHGGRATPRPGYGPDALRAWIERLQSLSHEGVGSAFVYFNNDHGAMALRDAVVLARIAAAAGLEVSRVPDPSELRWAPGT